jgi:putative tryptophan/tyrosine transport system substrate-binding protein
MRRREFVALFGGAAITWARAAHAQQSTLPLVGMLSSASLSALTDLLGPFRQGLKEAGYIEGQNVAIDSRYAEGHFERLPSLAAELVQRRPAVIVTTGGSSTLAVRAASSTVPHVFLSQDDPVKLGLVVSFNHPGGNATGVSLLTSALVAKRLEFVRQLAPAGAPISYLMNP